MRDSERPATLGALKQSGYQVLPIREEMQRNLVRKLGSGRNFPRCDRLPGHGDSRAGKRHSRWPGCDPAGGEGQAKTRLLRSLVSLLDEYTPIIAGVEIPENPFEPISAQARALVAERVMKHPLPGSIAINATAKSWPRRISRLPT